MEEKAAGELCRKLRAELIQMLYRAQTGHPGGSLSVTEILVALYFGQARVDPRRPDWHGRDRVVLCKGHAAPMLYLVLAEKGFFAKAELAHLRQCGGMLPGHPSAKATPGVDLASGPLGIGLSAALGMALAQRLDGLDAYTYAVLGDGELNEGTVWEALMSAVKFGADNLIAIVDNNSVQLDGSCGQIMPMGELRVKFEAFGARVIEVDGHDVAAVSDAITRARQVKGGPVVILAKTVKGKGVSFMEGDCRWHGSPIGEAEYRAALRELEGGL